MMSSASSRRPLATLLVLLLVSPSEGARVALDAASLSLGAPLGSGTYGKVRWGQLGAGRVVCKTADISEPRAATYLDTEAYINAHLSGAAPDHLAPYLGSCTVDGERTLGAYRSLPRGPPRMSSAPRMT